MRKIVSVIALAALLAAALIVAVCTSVKFDNPLDEKGSNFLYGNTDDRDAKLADDGTGQAALFTDPRFECDETPPIITLKGKNKDTINTQQFSDLTRYMGGSGGGFTDLVSTSKQGAVIEAALTRGNPEVVISHAKMPDPGEYIIFYYAVWNPACFATIGKDAVKTSTQRALTIELYIPVDDAKPSITISGSQSVSIEVGKAYKEDGVMISDGKGGSFTVAEALDSVRVNNKTVSRKPVSYALVEQEINNASGVTDNVGTYTIMYYATSPKTANGGGVSADPKTRTVVVTPPSGAGLKAAVIVLNNYEYTIDGKKVSIPDTLISEVNKSNPSAYQEKDFKRVYYIKDGEEVTVNNPSVAKTAPNLGSVSMSSMIGSTSARYTVPASAGNYLEGVVTRPVYVYFSPCDVSSPPTITGVTPTLSVPAGTKWTPSWGVSGRDVVDQAENFTVSGGKLGIDYGGLNPDSPVKGTYKVIYVAMSACGKLAAVEQTVTVP